MTTDGFTGETITIALDQEQRRAAFSMRGAKWKGEPYEITLAPEAGGFLIRTNDEADPIEQRFGTWTEAIDAFADDVRLHVHDVLREPMGERELLEKVRNLTKDQQERLLRAIFGEDPEERGDASPVDRGRDRPRLP